MLYLEENIRQQVLATLFEVSQPTISRAITRILTALDTILPSPPTPKDLDVHRFYVLDGTLVECWGWKNHQKLYSGKHKKTGFNLQILTDQAGEIYYVSNPLPGSTHDINALRQTNLLDSIPPDHITADKGYIGSGCDVPFRRQPHTNLHDWQQRFNKNIQRIRYVVERAIAHLKTWKILATPNRLPLTKAIQTITIIRKIIFYEPPPE